MLINPKFPLKAKFSLLLLLLFAFSLPPEADGDNDAISAERQTYFDEYAKKYGLEGKRTPPPKVYKVKEYYDRRVEQKVPSGNQVTRDLFIAEICNEVSLKYHNDDLDLLEMQNRNMDIASICYVASEIRSVTPLSIFKSQFGLEINAYKKHFSTSFTVYKQKITDYPMIYLALTCGELSVDPLQEIILDNTINSESRVLAITTLHTIDPVKSKSALAIARDDLAPYWLKTAEAFMKNPSDEPWNLSPYRELREGIKKKLEDGTLKQFGKK